VKRFRSKLDLLDCRVLEWLRWDHHSDHEFLQNIRSLTFHQVEDRDDIDDLVAIKFEVDDALLALEPFRGISQSSNEDLNKTDEAIDLLIEDLLVVDLFFGCIKTLLD
jgi:hypothetical protein